MNIAVADLHWYFRVGHYLGLLVAVPLFIGLWIYAIAAVWFLGIPFGWLPAGIMAALAYAATMTLWGPAAALIALSAIFLSGL